MSSSGPWQQVSRLGNPLINEVIIPTAKKDYWNSQKPYNDSQFAKYYQAPELTAVANALYDALDTPATTNRERPRGDPADRAQHPGLGDRARAASSSPGPGTTQADMLRVNTGIKPNAAGACVFGVAGGGTPSRLGALDGDLCGFPNGRRLLDDVTDIELRALVEGYGPILNAVLGVPNRTPNNLLGDGVDANDLPFLSAFPYIGTPHQGYEHDARARRPLIAPPSRSSNERPGHAPGPFGFSEASETHPTSYLVPAGNAKYFRAVQGQDYRIWWPSRGIPGNEHTTGRRPEASHARGQDVSQSNSRRWCAALDGRDRRWTRPPRLWRLDGHGAHGRSPGSWAVGVIAVPQRGRRSRVRGRLNLGSRGARLARRLRATLAPPELTPRRRST